MTRARLVTAAFVAAVLLFTFLALPPARLATDASWRDRSVAGAVHVHTNRSDGRSSPEAVAAAAARAGLSFVIFTDHGDATRIPDAPAYHSGVLCIDAVEISTTGGHYVALGLSAAPYALGGEPADVVEDVHRLGGMGIVAHPDSPKEALRWSEWGLPVDGVELINPDTSWRHRVFATRWRSPRLIAESLFSYAWRAPQTMARMLTDSPDLLGQWIKLLEQRPVVGLMGIDAHAKLELRNGEPGDNRFSLPLPGYESSFRLLAVHVTPETALTGDAAADAPAVLDAIRRGHLYTAVDAWASPPAFEFTAQNASGTATQGDTLTPDGSLTLHVRSNAPAAFETVVWRGGTDVARRRGEQDISISASEPDGIYRVEIRRPESDDGPPWIVSNPIYVRGARPEVRSPALPPARSAMPLIAPGNANGWAIENDPTSVAAVAAVNLAGGSGVLVRYGLSGGSRHNQFAGAAVEIPAVAAGFDRIAFTARSEQPMRVSIQIRENSAKQERWQKSVYLDETERPFVMPLSELKPVGEAPPAIPAAIRSILFIVDTANTKPGASGRVWLRDVRVEKSQ